MVVGFNPVADATLKFEQEHSHFSSVLC